MNDLGKPCAGKPHARFDEGRLETGTRVLGPPSLQRTAWTAPDSGPPRQSPTLPVAARRLVDVGTGTHGETS